MTHDKLEIRSTELDDYAALRALHAQPNAVRGTLQLPYPSVEEWKKRLAQRPDNLYGLVACIDCDIVGSLALFAGARSPRRRHVGEIGIAIHDAWQGKGIGTALLHAAIDLADNWLNLHRLELTVFTDNEAAIALYEKFGFKHEGRFEQYAFRNGSYVDAFAMARIKQQEIN